jgi:hypothetical protein
MSFREISFNNSIVQTSELETAQRSAPASVLQDTVKFLSYRARLIT